MTDKPKLLYLIGPPGAGKTTLMQTAIGMPHIEACAWPFAYLRYPGGAQLGGYRESFGGTDTLSMSVQPKVLDWLGQRHFRAIVGEGDRLANAKFFEAVPELGYELTVVCLDASPELSAERCAERGSNQNPTWLKGRFSKTAGLSSKYVRAEWWFDAAEPVEVLAERLRQHPALLALRGTVR